ncbi:MAG: META domain-containing protein [Methanomicrobiales archaeon]|nr:META domain-containing protein [Methanomicrobiales archaeon]
MKPVVISTLIGVMILVMLLAGCTMPELPGQPPVTMEGTPPVTPVPPEVTPLTGTSWTLISGLSGGGTWNVLPGTVITATFGEDGQVSGSAGCNNYFAPYQSRLNSLTVGTAATTRMYCENPTGVMNQETLYLSNLEGAATYAVEGDLLMVYDTTGKTLLTYRKGLPEPTPLPFEGTAWSLDRYKAADGTMTAVLPTTMVTALFETGNLTGSAGCNSYFGSYTMKGENVIAIGPLGSTLMFCGEAGVMEQETAYLTLLQSAVSFEVSGAQLILSDAGGMPILEYSGS